MLPELALMALPFGGIAKGARVGLKAGPRILRFVPKRLTNIRRVPVAKTAPKVTKTTVAAPTQSKATIIREVAESGGRKGGVSKAKIAATGGALGLGVGTSYVALTQPGVISENVKKVFVEIGAAAGGAAGGAAGTTIREIYESFFETLLPGEDGATTNQIKKATKGVLPTGAEGGILLPLALLVGGIYLVTRPKKGRRKK